jgi:hypothetical protein
VLYSAVSEFLAAWDNSLTIRITRLALLPEHGHHLSVVEEPRELRASTIESALPKPRRIFAAVIGIGCLVAGGFATFVTSNGAGSAALLGTGLGLLVVAFLGNRLTSLKFGGLEATLQAAEYLYTSARNLEEDGYPEVADRLRSEAERLVLRAAPHARAYEDLRRTEPPGPERTAHMYEELVRKAREYSHEHRPSAGAVRQMFLGGEPGDRVFALVLMQEDPDAADFDSILNGIEHSCSAFEQYQAVDAAERRLRAGLDEQSRLRLRAALMEQTGPGGWITSETGRWKFAQRMLADLVESRPG